MQQVNGVPVYSEDPSLFYDGLDAEPTWFSAQGGVYRCQSRSQSKTPVAIKKYLVEETDEYPDLFVMPKELVENEIYTMTKCVHPNILKLLAVYLHREFVYLVMPYCTGGSLQQYAFEHHLTIGQLVHIIASIASGLAEVHRHGYIHRDIKCDNIFLVKETNEIVIGDFGVVSVTPAADSNVEEAGVVLFWSPELVQRKIINRKVDIWALGIVILEILNGGRAPYEDEQLDEEEIKQRILENGKPAYPPGLPSRLVNLLDMCLSPEPKTRASANDILKHPFLRDYEPEPLFPVRSAGSDQHESSHDDMSLDDSITMTHSDDMMTCDSSDMDFEDATMANALRKLRALEALHDIDMNIPDAPPSLSSASSSKHQRISSNATDKRSDVESMDLSISANISQTENRSSTSNTSSSDSAHKPTSETKDHKARPRVQMSDIRRCRLPIRAFTLKEEEISSTTAKEKVLNVLKKRQSISEAHWGQGSRLPMFKAMSPPPETLYEKAISAEKKLRRAKSVRLPKDVSIPTSPEKSVRKPLVRSNTAPSHSTQLSLAKSADKKRPDSSKKIAEKARVRSPSKEETENQPTQRLRPKVLLVAPRHKEEPPKKRLSIYRRKCPPGESRTARLMMGISTTGRRTSRDTTSSSKTEQSPPREVRSLPKMLRFGAGTESADKRRLAADRKRLSQNLQPQSTQTTPLPVSDIKARRQSAPAPPKKTTAKDDSTGKSPALKPGVKVLRVH